MTYKQNTHRAWPIAAGSVTILLLGASLATAAPDQPPTTLPAGSSPVDAGPVEPGSSPAERAPLGPPVLTVVGGKFVKEGYRKYLVKLNGCTATLIAPTWVLSAKHCMGGGGGGQTVYYGSVYVNKMKRARGSRTYTHPRNDIALIKLASPITGIKPVKIASKNPAVGTKVKVYGWGMTSKQGGRTSSRLKTAHMKFARQGQDTYGGPAMFLTGINGGAWKGDSGGPAINGHVQVGVCSTGDPSRSNNYYALVGSARSWIKQTAGV